MKDILHHPGLWRSIAWGEGIVALLDGASYFTQGNGVGQGPSFYVLRQIPFGLHTYGVIMLVLGAFIFYSSAERRILARRVQFATFVISIWISVAIVVSWILANSVSFGSVTKWFFIAWTAMALYYHDTRRLDNEGE